MGPKANNEVNSNIFLEKEDMKKVTILAMAVVLLISTACSSRRVAIETGPLAPNEKKLGTASGQDTGVLLFGLIPIGQNGRFEGAYHEAVSKFPGATRLVDATIEEKWFWAWILTGYKFRVRGTAVGPE